MASCTLQDWSWEEPGAPCCLAGPICLTRSGCFDTTWGFPSLNWHAANGCIHALAQVQRAPARSILLCSRRRVLFGRYGMGDSQAYATQLAGSGVWQVQRSACLAFLADVGLHPLRRA